MIQECYFRYFIPVKQRHRWVPWHVAPVKNRTSYEIWQNSKTCRDDGPAGWISKIINSLQITYKYPTGAHPRIPLRWRHNGRASVSNHQPHDCLLNRLFRRRSKKTSKLRVTGLCVGNSPGTGEFPTQRPSNAGNVSNWWRHHALP